MIKRFIKIAVLILGIGFIYYYAIWDNGMSPAMAAVENKPAPNFKLKDIDGKDVKLSDYKGKVVIVDFWATWCVPCKKEIPDFIDLQNKYEKQGFTFIGISVDEDGAKVVKPFYKEMKMNYPVLLMDNKIQEQFGGIRGYPTTFLIDQNGKIIKKYFGTTEKKVFEDDIKSLLAKQKNQSK